MGMPLQEALALLLGGSQCLGDPMWPPFQQSRKRVAARHSKDEASVGNVSWQKPSRLSPGAVQPFQADSLHPHGSAARPPHDKIERSADLHSDCRSQDITVFGQPQFAFGLAEGNEKQVRAAIANVGDQSVVLTRRKLVEIRCGRSGDL